MWLLLCATCRLCALPLAAVLAKPALVIAAMSLAALGTAWAAEAVLGGMGVAADRRLAAMGVSLLGIAAGWPCFAGRGPDRATDRRGAGGCAQVGASPCQATAQTACAALTPCSRCFYTQHSEYAIIEY